ncbi:MULTISPECIES: S-type pyocin domain-containing protein [unclassified Pseudomonas]|uniref:S-type pyocin domain-containing protein n=1 Tax=unclassified Pseudomonas TaxID=196821 RepID=UPI00200DD4C2|nr:MULTISPECIES: S-type pyocin domain-containing protein [unclassified Pseudomonas]
MKLKSTLGEYTEPEFQTLVDRIWAVDLPEADHNRLINHFDRIAGHPRGADLLFYHPKTERNPNSSGVVVYHVKAWHGGQGRAAFKGQSLSAATAPSARPRAPVDWAQVTQQRIAKSLADAHKISGDLTVSERAAEAALTIAQERLADLRQRQSVQVDVVSREADIRSVEAAELDALAAIGRYESWEMRVRFKKDDALGEVTRAQAERGQWQNIAQQITATYDSYVVKLKNIHQRFKHFQTQSEALLTSAQTQLVELREQLGSGSAQLFAPLVFISARPAILVDGALSRPLESHRVDLQKAIRSAVSEFTWQSTSSTPAEQAQFAEVLQFGFRSRADTGLYGVCVPLAELIPVEGLDWQYLAATLGAVDVPFRLSSGTYSVPTGTLFQGIREIKTLHQVILTPANVDNSTSGVRVRAAVWDDVAQTYSFTADGSTPVTVNWCPPDTLETALPPAAITPYRLGFIRSASVPLLETFSDPADVVFEDYVVVFPKDSGLDPAYVMFRNPLEFARSSRATSQPVAPPETR